jgi:hypothetical protein
MSHHFTHDNFLLQGETARRLYHATASILFSNLI